VAIDIRSDAAKFYDLNPDVVDDLAFYRARIPFPDASVLELGCGTGRVLVPLSKDCGYIHGVDISAAMVSRCQDRLANEAILHTKARADVGDITAIHLGRKFDLIIAPFRVFQNLETDSEINGFFDTVRRHMSPIGTCILNVFKPNRNPDELCRHWTSTEEYFCWDVPVDGGRATCHVKKARIDPDRLILYPELIYRTYRGNELADEVVLKIVMRCYYPADFEQLITAHGFNIVQSWGGYAGETYGEGPELVIEFREGR
jgi:ubiquinone/menaquinone biosynthesis C-methylase UbiE